LEINIFISRVIYLTPARNSGNRKLAFFHPHKNCSRERFVVIRVSEALRAKIDHHANEFQREPF
jgi:hypothetical protein